MSVFAKQRRHKGFSNPSGFLAKIILSFLFKVTDYTTYATTNAINLLNCVMPDCSISYIVRCTISAFPSDKI